MLLFLKKIKNSFLTPRIYNFVVNENFYKNYDKNYKKNNLIKKIFLKIFYFYPNLHDTYEWKFGDKNKHRSFEDFKNYRSYNLFILNFISKKIKNKKLKILDLGCNQGRHIKYLHNKKFNNLYGVDIMKKAITVFKKNSSIQEKKHINIKQDYIQRYLNSAADNFFFASYTFGATIELLHPSFDIVKELIRVSRRYIFLYINENEHWYPRFYVYEFKRNNTKLIYKKKFGKMSFLVFKKMS